MDYTNITIYRDEFTTNPILHDEEWCMMLWRYCCTCCATVTSFIMKSLRSIWTIEFATIIRDTTTKLRGFDVNMFFASILIYGGSIVVLVCIAGVFMYLIMGLWGLIATTKDTTDGTKDPIENKDATKNTKDPTENTEAGEPLLPSLPTGAVSTDTAPPPLVSEPTGPHTAIEQLRDNIQSLLGELESKMTELESSIVEESSTSSFANSTTDDSTTDDSASNEEADENNERIEREPPTKAQAKANALLWQQRQLANINRQRRQQRQLANHNRQLRQQKKGY